MQKKWEKIISGFWIKNTCISSGHPKSPCKISKGSAKNWEELRGQEAHGPRAAHLSDTATADMQMFVTQHFPNPVIATNEKIIL